MARGASTLLVLALLGATAGAFALAERLKLTPAPIADTHVDKVISPTCGCRTASASIDFVLRRADRLTLSILDGGGDVVRTLVRSERVSPGRFQERWDGRDDAGYVLPEGSYKPRVRLAERRRTIVLPNPIRVDVTPPQLTVGTPTFTRISPDGDGRRDWTRIPYRVSESAHGLLFVEGVRQIRTLAQKRRWHVDWFGKLADRRLPAGTYALSLAAEDIAGNVSPRSGPIEVRIRFVELARDRIGVRAGNRFGVRVLTDAPSVRWRLAGRSGTAPRGLLVLRAPRRPGAYRLYVAANGHADVARVTVAPRGR